MLHGTFRAPILGAVTTPPPATVPPDTFVNLRDVAGLLTGDGRAVRAGVLYRSELPRSASPDLPEGFAWPPSVVIDLRMPREYLAPTHPLDRPGTDVRAVPLGAALAPAPAVHEPADQGTGGEPPPRRTPADHYLLLMRVAGDAVADVVRTVADADGPVLVHCTAGKDRTGILVAVLLRAVGVRREDIAADYLRTEENLDALLDALADAGVQLPRDRRRLSLVPEGLEAVLDELDAAPGGAAGWLRERGVADTELDRLSARLLGSS